MLMPFEDKQITPKILTSVSGFVRGGLFLELSSGVRKSSSREVRLWPDF